MNSCVARSINRSVSVVTLILALAFALASCIGIDADAGVSAGGSVTLKLSYACVKSVDELRLSGSLPGFGILPVTREDLELALSKSPGSELRSWNRSDTPESFTVTTELAFPSPQALATFLDPSGQKATFSQTGTNRTFSLTITEGKRVSSPEFASYVGKVYGDYAVKILVQLPSAPKRVEGFEAERNLVRYERKSNELYASESPVRLVVVW